MDDCGSVLRSTDEPSVELHARNSFRDELGELSARLELVDVPPSDEGGVAGENHEAMTPFLGLVFGPPA